MSLYRKGDRVYVIARVDVEQGKTFVLGYGISQGLCELPVDQQKTPGQCALKVKLEQDGCEYFMPGFSVMHPSVVPSYLKGKKVEQVGFDQALGLQAQERSKASKSIGRFGKSRRMGIDRCAGHKA